MTFQKDPNRKELIYAFLLVEATAVPGVSQQEQPQLKGHPLFPLSQAAASVNTYGLLRRLGKSTAKDHRVPFVMGVGLRHQVTSCGSQVGFRLLSAPGHCQVQSATRHRGGKRWSVKCVAKEPYRNPHQAHLLSFEGRGQKLL